MNQTFNARSNLNKCAVVVHHNHAARNLVAHLQIGIELVPRMRLQLLQAEGNALLLVVKVENHHIELLVRLNDVGGIAHAAPREVGDVNQAVHAAEVNKHTVAGDVLHSAFEHLTLLKLGNDFFLLLFEFGLDKCLVRNNHVAELLVDFHHLELHGLAHKHIVVANGAHIDLAAGQECLDAKHVNDHATFGAAFDETFDDLIVLKRLINAIPTLGCARLAVRQDELTLFVLLVFNKHFHSVAHLEVGVVTEFVKGNDAVRLRTDVNHHLALVDGDDGTFGHVLVFERTQGFVVGFFQFFVRFVSLSLAFFIGIPIKVDDWRIF